MSAKFPELDIRIVDVDMGIYPLGESYGAALKDVARLGDIRVLVNNAGKSHDMPVTFEDTTEQEMEAIVGVNIGGVIRATKETLPYLLDNPRKKRWIVNVGSFAGYAPTPVSLHTLSRGLTW
jgi:17beta-estradiol 17-dehydrogenase / very-long-chain 3-oxoacyl-CoA reductase